MIVRRYIKNNDLYVFPFQIEEKNKIRTIVTYKKDTKGFRLRMFHNRLLWKLSKFKSSKYSYAYKKGLSTKDAFKPHMKSILFIKLDIESFFENITKDRFLKFCNAETKKIGKRKLETCFYKNHVSLGYVTSPRLSDIYLYKFDLAVEKYLDNHKTLHYSRYSDDILISCEEDNYIELYSFFNFIKKTLKEYELSVNENKYKEFNLNKHTSVSFLGLNLKLKDGVYDITISKRFVVKTLDLVDKLNRIKDQKEEVRLELQKGLKELRFNLDNNIKDLSLDGYLKDKRALYKKLDNKRHILKGVIKSRAAYIRFNSMTTYMKFLKKFRNKYGCEWNAYPL